MHNSGVSKQAGRVSSLLLTRSLAGVRPKRQHREGTWSSWAWASSVAHWLCGPARLFSLSVPQFPQLRMRTAIV